MSSLPLEHNSPAVKEVLNLKTKAGTLKVFLYPDGDIRVETFQRLGKKTYYLRNIIHPDGKLAEW